VGWVCRGWGDPRDGVVGVSQSHGQLGAWHVGHVGPWLLTEKLSAKGWGNQKTCGSAGPMKTRLQPGSALGETEESKVTPTVR